SSYELQKLIPLLETKQIRPIIQKVHNVESIQPLLQLSIVTLAILGPDVHHPLYRLPSWVTNISFGFHFNQSVNNLPGSVTVITFGPVFHRAVDSLPAGDTNNEFGYHFNEAVDDLPVSVTHITVG